MGRFVNQHYDLGYDCAISGGRVDDNPYHYGCIEQASWEQGYSDGYKWVEDSILEDNNNDGFGHDIWHGSGED